MKIKLEPLSIWGEGYLIQRRWNFDPPGPHKIFFRKKTCHSKYFVTYTYAFSDVFQKGLQCDKWHKKTGGRMDGCALRFVGQVGPNLPRMYAQICRVCMPKSAAQNETLDGDIEDRCGGGVRGGFGQRPDFFRIFFATFPKNNL